MSLPTEAQARKDVPIATGVVDYFPLALASIAQLSRLGNEQHNPGQPLHWDRSKSTDDADALMRHFVERGTFDTDNVRHSTKVAWRALALLQKEIEASNAAFAAESKPMTATEVQERWNAGPPRVEAAELVYVRYTGDGPRKGWWWREGQGLTDNLSEAGLFAWFPKGALRIELVPQDKADYESRWVLETFSGEEWETLDKYTEKVIRSYFNSKPVRRI